MIDIHMHLTFGVDDGAKDLEMSLEMLRIAAEQGITAIVATYHSDNYLKDIEKIKNNFKILQEAITEHNIPIRIYFGCEVFWAISRKDEVLEKLEKGINATMNETKYVLVEFWPDEDIDPIEEVSDCIFTLVNRGYIPILAHVERYAFTTVEAVEKWKSEGAYIQMNIYSVKEESSPKIRGVAEALLKEQLVDITGSDAHRMDHRAPRVQVGIESLYSQYDKAYVDEILFENAMMMLGIEG